MTSDQINSDNTYAIAAKAASGNNTNMNQKKKLVIPFFRHSKHWEFISVCKREEVDIYSIPYTQNGRCHQLLSTACQVGNRFHVLQHIHSHCTRSHEKVATVFRFERPYIFSFQIWYKKKYVQCILNIIFTMFRWTWPGHSSFLPAHYTPFNPRSWAPAGWMIRRKRGGVVEVVFYLHTQTPAQHRQRNGALRGHWRSALTVCNATRAYQRVHIHNAANKPTNEFSGVFPGIQQKKKQAEHTRKVPLIHVHCAHYTCMDIARPTR